jgi:hypothetical protein
MTAHITNISNALVSVELNSGRTLHLAPGERSEGIEQFEVGDNPWIRTLVERGRLTVDSPIAQAAHARGRREKRAGASPQADG